MTETGTSWQWKLSPTGLVKALLGLRGAAMAAYPLATLAGVIFQRGFFLVVLLAAAMLVLGELERRRAMRLAGKWPPGLPRNVLMGFFIRLGALTALFIVLTGFLALFRDTSLARGLGWPDMAILFVFTALALAANEVSARLAVNRMGDAVNAIRGALGAERFDARDAEGEIIDGEVIEPEAPPSKPDQAANGPQV
jgi:hypothetical protein